VSSTHLRPRTIPSNSTLERERNTRLIDTTLSPQKPHRHGDPTEKPAQGASRGAHSVSKGTAVGNSSCAAAVSACAAFASEKRAHARFPHRPKGVVRKNESFVAYVLCKGQRSSAGGCSRGAKGAPGAGGDACAAASEFVRLCETSTRLRSGNVDKNVLHLIGGNAGRQGCARARALAQAAG
jgi:hypothetical protein